MVSSTHDHHEWLRKRKFKTPVTREDVEKDWKPRGFTCSLFTDAQGDRERNFKHSDDELICSVSGGLEVTIDTEIVQLQPGDEVFIPAGVQHSTKKVGAPVAEWLYGYG